MSGNIWESHTVGWAARYVFTECRWTCEFL